MKEIVTEQFTGTNGKVEYAKFPHCQNRCYHINEEGMGVNFCENYNIMILGNRLKEECSKHQ